MDKLTVAHLLPPYNPFPPVYPAGTELRVEQVARRQEKYRPLVVCGGFPGEAAAESMGSAMVRRIHFGRAYRRLFQKITRLDPWPYAARMWRIVREERASLLHIHNEPKLLAGLAPLLDKHPMPLVVHVANEKPLPTEAASVVTHWVACSHYMRDWLIRANGIPAERTQVIYTGVDIGRRKPWWAIDPQERVALRRRFGVLEDRALVITFAGRLVKEKGVAELLDAFDLLRARIDRPVYLLVAGNVRESNDPKNEKAVYGKAMAERMARQPNVHWVGSLRPGDVHEFLAAGDLFALPSIWHDPFPTVMLEAAAAGQPMIAGARGGITEFLAGSPVPALLERPEDPAALCDKMLGLLADEPGRKELGQWLRARVETEFGWERVTRDFEALYDRLLGAQ